MKRPDDAASYVPVRYQTLAAPATDLCHHSGGVDDPDATCLRVESRAGKESENPNFKGSYLSRFPLISADVSTSGHLSERSRSVNVGSGARARKSNVEATLNHSFPAQVQSDDATLQLLADPLLVEDIAFHGPIPAGGEVRWRGNPLAWTVDGARVAANEHHFREVLGEDRAAVEANGRAAQGCEGGQLQTAPILVVFHSFWLMFRRGIISRNGLEA